MSTIVYRCRECHALHGEDACSACGAAAGSPVVAPDERVFDAGSDIQLDRVAHITAMSPEAVRDLVPSTSGGLIYVACPNCEHEARDRAPWDWTPEKPFQISCGSCGAVYPDHPEYPDDEYLEVDAPNGTHRFPYHTRTEDGHRLFFEGRADFYRRAWLARCVQDLGRHYYTTGDPTSAEYAAIILHRFAEVVPGWAYRYDFPFEETLFSPYHTDEIDGAPGHRTTLWTRWIFDDIPTDALEGYESIMVWDGLDASTAEDIEADFFAYLTEYVLEREPMYGNASPRIMRDATRAGWVLERPDWVHESVERFEAMLATQFSYDGHWCEPAPAYHRMTLHGLWSFMDAAEGYTDPPGYHHPASGRRFDSYQPSAGEPQYALAETLFERVRYPDGTLLPVNDSWATPSRKEGYRDEIPLRETTDPLVLGGMGVGILGGGQGDGQWMAWLNATSSEGHKHRDALSMAFYANGREFFPDLGYTHTRYRRSWAASTMAHNTVVIDGHESGLDPDHTGTQLTAVGTSEPAIQLIAGESTTAYPVRTDRYRRTLLAIGIPGTAGYLIDRFDVIGGSQHDYVLHGSADEDSHMQVPEIDLEPYDGDLMNPGMSFVPPSGQYDRIADGQGAYGMITNLKQGWSNGSTTIDIRMDADSTAGTRTILAPMPETSIFVGSSPSIRRADENDLRVDEYRMPSLVASRSGENLTSCITAIHEAVAGRPSLQTLTAEHDDAMSVIAIGHEDGHDLVLISRTQGPATGHFETEHGSVGCDGDVVVFRHTPNGTLTDIRAYGCASVTLDGESVETDPGWTGEIVGVDRTNRRDAHGKLILDRAVTANCGETIMLTFPDGTHQPYTILEMTAAGGQSTLYTREVPGFEMGEVQIVQTTYPERVIDGTKVRFRLARFEAIDPERFDM